MIGHTYFNNKAALQFVKAIAAVEIDKTVEMINAASFFSAMMNDSTDITGEDQETVYLIMSLVDKDIDNDDFCEGYLNEIQLQGFNYLQQLYC